ncbi:MAG: hypothetical protein HOQ01_09935 [Lysobacter sp.]|nr:hypothetical protein [Lysobacter sp.]
MLTGVVWVVMAGVAGAVGAAQAQVQLSFTNFAGGQADVEGGPAASANLHGIADLFWRNTANGSNVIWKNGLSTSQRAMAGFSSVWQVQPQEAQP